jgi:hypothetical protein
MDVGFIIEDHTKGCPWDVPNSNHDFMDEPYSMKVYVFIQIFVYQISSMELHS